MSEPVTEMLLVQRELLGGKPHQSVLVQVELDGVDACDEQVEAEVKLEAPHQQRVGDVSLDYRVADSVRDLFEIFGQYDAISLRAPGWFADPECRDSTDVLVLLYLQFQLPRVRRKVESLRHEGKIFLPKLFLHRSEVVGHLILPGERVGGGELVHPDGGVQLAEVHGV